MSAPTLLPLPSLPEPDTVESQTWSLAFMLCPAQVIIHPSVKQSTEPQPCACQLGCLCCHCLLTPQPPHPLIAIRVPPSPAPSASPLATLSPSAWTWPLPSTPPQSGHQCPRAAWDQAPTWGSHPDLDTQVRTWGCLREDGDTLLTPAVGPASLRAPRPAVKTQHLVLSCSVLSFPTWQVDVSASLLQLFPEEGKWLHPRERPSHAH